MQVDWDSRSSTGPPSRSAIGGNGSLVMPVPLTDELLDDGCRRGFVPDRHPYRRLPSRPEASPAEPPDANGPTSSRLLLWPGRLSGDSTRSSATAHRLIRPARHIYQRPPTTRPLDSKNDGS